MKKLTIATLIALFSSAFVSADFCTINKYRKVKCTPKRVIVKNKCNNHYRPVIRKQIFTISFTGFTSCQKRTIAKAIYNASPGWSFVSSGINRYNGNLVVKVKAGKHSTKRIFKVVRKILHRRGVRVRLQWNNSRAFLIAPRKRGHFHSIF